MKRVKLPDYQYLENEIEFSDHQKITSWPLKFIRNIGSYIFAGITLFSFLLVYIILHISADIEFKIFIEALIVGALLLIPFLIYFGYEEYKYRKSEKKRKLNFEQFKYQSIKLSVDLKNVRIKKKSNGFCITVFEIPYSQKSIIIEYEATIQMSPDKLYLHFVVQKETIFYVNENDIHNHYLDLTFLD